MEWTPSRRLHLVVRIMRGQTSVPEAARTYELPTARINDWLRRAMRGALGELHARGEPARPEAALENFVEFL